MKDKLLTTKLLTTKEAAEALGVSLPRVHQLIRAGVLRAERLGARTVLIRAEYVEAARNRRRPGRLPDAEPSAAAVAKRRSREKMKGKSDHTRSRAFSATCGREK